MRRSTALLVAAVAAAVVAAVAVGWWWWQWSRTRPEPFDAGGGAFARPRYRPPPPYSYIMDATVPWAAEPGGQGADAARLCARVAAAVPPAVPRAVTFELSDDASVMNAADAALAAEYRGVALASSREWLLRADVGGVQMSECASRVRVASRSGRAYVDTLHVVGPAVDQKFVTVIAEVEIRSLDDASVVAARCAGTVAGDRLAGPGVPAGAAVDAPVTRSPVTRDDPALVAGMWVVTNPVTR